MIKMTFRLKIGLFLEVMRDPSFWKNVKGYVWEIGW